VLVIFSRLIGESITEGEDGGSDDEEIDGGDDEDTSEVCNSFLLWIPSLSWPSTLASHVILQTLHVR